MTAEAKEKVDRSGAEILDLTERELRCPYCGHFIMTLYSDVAGHLKAKCGHCKQITTFSPEDGRAQLARHNRFSNTIPKVLPIIDNSTIFVV